MLSAIALQILIFGAAFHAASTLILWPEKPRQLKAKLALELPYRRKSYDPIVASNPIVLVPGDAGSRLRANLTGKPEVVHRACYSATTDFFDLWLNLELFYPIVIDCWADNMRLVFDNVSLSSENSPGVDIDVPSFGNTDSVEWLDSSKRSPGLYFAPLVEALTSWGYKRGLNVVGAPFDWRKAPNELNDYYVQLRTLIEILYNYSGKKRVVILAHSMGNPVMQYFYHRYVDQEWKDKYLESHVALAGAWGGAAQIMKLFTSGYNMDHYRIVLPPSRLRAMQRSFISSAFLFPSDRLWTKEKEEVLVATPQRNYTRSDEQAFFRDVDYELGQAMHGAVKDTLILDAPGVEVHCIFGNDIPTPEQFVWTTQSYFPDSQPQLIINGNGDGTVNDRSLRVCGNWTPENNQGKSVELYPLTGTDHLGILQDKRAIAILRNILYKATS